MLSNLDGLWLNMNHVSACYPQECTNTTTGESFYRIRFRIEPEGYLGETRYKSKEDCQTAIEKLIKGVE